jgi:hypothetical protein
MKKVLLALLICTVAGACATLRQNHEVRPITVADLPALKGHWEGTRNIVIQQWPTLNFAEMDVLNDTVPLRGRVTLQLRHPIDGNYMEIRTLPFWRGLIDEGGYLDITFSETYRMAVAFEGLDRKTLSGVFFHGGNRGTITLRKKPD